MKYFLKKNNEVVAGFMYCTDARTFLTSDVVVEQEYEMFCEETFICGGGQATAHSYDSLFKLVKEIMGWN